MLKCVGLEFKSGTFVEKESNRSIPYDNVVLHYMSNQNPNVVGTECGQLKIKREQFSKVCALPAQELIDKDLYVEYQPIGGKLTVTKIMPVSSK